MRRQGLVAKAGRKFKATTNSRHKLPVAPNLLEQDFTCSAINEKWCGDITYVWTNEGWMYLAMIGWFSIDGLFRMTAVSALVGIALLHTIVPNPGKCHYNADTGANLATMKRLFKNKQRLRLDVSIFMLHLMITAVFFAVPLALRDAGIASDKQWLVYLPAVILSFGVMIPLIIWGERKAMRAVLLLCIVGMLFTQVLFAGPLILGIDSNAILLWVTAFFCFLNTLEALLPSLVSGLAPAAAKGSAMGIDSTSQFMGAFVGGAGAGWLYGLVAPLGVFSVMALLCVIWVLLVRGFEPPRKMTTHRRALSEEQREQPRNSLIQELETIPGVEKVVIALDEGVAYLKVDKNQFSESDLSLAQK